MEKKRYRQKQAAALAMQTILRGYMARQKYQGVKHTSHKSLRKIAPKNRLEISIIVSVLISLCLSFNGSVSVSVATAAAHGSHHSETHSWLVGPVLVQALPRVHRLPAVLHPQDEGKARVEEAEDRGSLSGALQEAQQRHGEQDHAAAEEGRRAGEIDFFYRRFYPQFYFT